MSVRRSRRTAAAIVLAAAVTALMPSLANAATPAAAHATHVAPQTVNGTKGNGLTISDGTPYVVMNGTVVKFGTSVRDLVWNPSGTKAAYIDSYGDLETANANGSDRSIVTVAPANGSLASPTWQVTQASDVQTHNPALDNLVFEAQTTATTSRLESISATAHFGKPTVLHLWQYNGEAPLPQTGNVWPSAGGTGAGAILAYENTDNGTGEIYIHDDYLRAQGGALVAGKEPAVSPNGEEIAFVRSVAGHDHLFVENLSSGKHTIKDITPSSKADYAQPAWSANGTQIAFDSSTGGIDTISPNGGAITHVSGYNGVLAYRG